MQEPTDHDVLSVTTTVGSMEDARRLARGLVERRLAACVQVEEGLLSFYRWEGRLCEDPEVRLTIKTRAECADALRDWLAEHHPYEVPQILAVVMRASAAYAQWVRAEVDMP
jgi:periplasmic divalent cation tolerance protein